MHNSTKNLKIDSLDRKILSFLTKNARMPFVEVARKCGVSGAAVHQRVNQMMNNGVVRGSQFILSHNAMGYNTCAFIGIQLNLLTRKSHIEAFSKIMNIPEIDIHKLQMQRFFLKDVQWFGTFVNIYSR